MLKHTFALILIANLLITTKNFAQDFKGKAASYPIEAYGDTTTSGDILNAKTFTSSHEYFPIGTVVEIVNLKNKKVI
jgi:rare lipoprotein A (peptidoglycan hydrolase)